MALIIAFSLLSLTHALVPADDASSADIFVKGKNLDIKAAIAKIIPSDFWNSTEPVNFNTTDNVDNANITYSLPMVDPDPKGRAARLAQDAYGYQYSESLIGKSSQFIGGLKGFAVMYKDIGLWLNDAARQRENVQAESAVARQALQAVRPQKYLSCFANL